VIDPETLRQIEELSHDDRPLLVLDVDDVVLDFVGPLPRYLESIGYRLTLGSYKLTGNIHHMETGAAAEAHEVRSMLDGFFAAQADWQELAPHASTSIATIAESAEVVMLTAMPHRHRDVRRSYFDTLGLPYPLLTTEMAKGPALKRLRGKVDRPVAFVDDLPHNLDSAREWVPDAHLFHLVSNETLRKILPAPQADVIAVQSWPEAAPQIAKALGI
jgi:hypothetical protein